MNNEQAIEEMKENIERLMMIKGNNKNNERKINAIDSEIEINKIALKYMIG